MVDWFAGLLLRYLRVSPAQTRRGLHLIGVILASAAFVLAATMLVAYDSIFLGANNVAALQVDDIAPQDIRAPISVQSYISKVLSDQRQQEVRDSVAESYFPPDPGVARQQTELAHQILLDGCQRSGYQRVRTRDARRNSRVESTLDYHPITDTG
jgi:hypothetical protein